MAGDWLSIMEVADELGVHHKTVRSWISKGELKATRFGKLLKISREEFERFTSDQGKAELGPTMNELLADARKLVDQLEDRLILLERQTG